MPLVAAYGSNNDNKTATPTVVAPTMSGKPVKIGVIACWTGPGAAHGGYVDRMIDIVEYQVKQEGGILGGRPVKFVKCDSQGSVAQVQACVTKLADDSSISAITLGGSSGAEIIGAIQACTTSKISLFTNAGYVDLPKYPYAVRTGGVTNDQRAQVVADFAIKKFNTGTVAFLADNIDVSRQSLSLVKAQMEAAGWTTVSEQYPNTSTLDFSPYITKIRYDNPDLLVTAIAAPTGMQSLYKQVMDQGGWGTTKVISLASSVGSADVLAQIGALGTYFWIPWIPGLPYAGSVKFEKDAVQALGKVPSPTDIMSYIPLWSAIEAIKLAGTDDRQAVANVIRSGNLKWESPAGLLVVGTDGETNIRGIIAMVGNGGVPQLP